MTDEQYDKLIVAWASLKAGIGILDIPNKPEYFPKGKDLVVRKQLIEAYRLLDEVVIEEGDERERKR